MTTVPSKTEQAFRVALTSTLTGRPTNRRHRAHRRCLRWTRMAQASLRHCRSNWDWSWRRSVVSPWSPARCGFEPGLPANRRL